MFPKPVAPSVPATSTDPADIKAWEDYYHASEVWAEMNKPCMRRDEYGF